jgi:hypothetical protein
VPEFIGLPPRIGATHPKSRPFIEDALRPQWSSTGSRTDVPDEKFGTLANARRKREEQPIRAKARRAPGFAVGIRGW